MKMVWHVYIDESGRKNLAGYVGNVELPFADSFASMKLFETEKGARRYINSLVRLFAEDFDVTVKELKAYDGGEFYKIVSWAVSAPALALVGKKTSKRVSVMIKAVARDLRK